MTISIDPEQLHEMMARRYRALVPFKLDVELALAGARRLREAEAALRESLAALNTKLRAADPDFAVQQIADLGPLPDLSRVIWQLESFFDD